MALRFVFPEADPSYLKSTEDIHDEAWWSENARQKILYNRWTVDGVAGALAAGPFTVLWHYAVFKSFGISFLSLRLLSLLSSVGLLFILWLSKKEELKKSTVLLAALPIIFDWSRLGHPEMMLSFLGISAYLIGSKKNNRNVLAAGFVSALALFVKGSFIYYVLPIALACSLTFPHEALRRLLLYCAGFAVICLPMWLFYYIPNTSFFADFYTLFSKDYYSWQQLLHPIGWLYRLVFISSKPFLQDPFILFFIASILLKRLYGQVPINTYGFTFILALCFFLLLGSDFAPRRFVFLFILLPLAWNEATFSKSVSIHFHIILLWVLSLSCMPFIWPSEIFQLGFEHGSLQFNAFFLPACFIHLVLIALVVFGFRFFNPSGKLIQVVSMGFVIIWTFFAFSKGISPHHLNPIESRWFLSGLIFLVIGLSVFVFLRKLTFIFLVFASIIWLGAYFMHISFQTRNAAQFLQVNAKAGTYAIGAGLPYTMTFLSPVSPVFHPKSPYKNQADWCIGISSPDFPERTAENSCMLAETPIQSHIHHFPLYHNRENVWIVKNK